jgi:hypothetical protein
MSGFQANNGLIIAEEAAPLLAEAGLVSFDDFMNFPGGTRICHKRGRSVFRLEIAGRAFYLKRNRFHRVEFLKRLSRLRLPVRGARQEWRNLLAVHAAGIPCPSPIAFGERPWCGLETNSFTVTEELYHCRPLDKVVQSDFSGMRTEKQRFRLRSFAQMLGRLAGKLHSCGMYHQDFYLSHIYVDREDSLFLIDLQRVLIRPAGSRHYQVKDLGQLNYAAEVTGGISRTSRLRFFLSYLDQPTLDPKGKNLIRAICRKTSKIARHDAKLTVRRRRRGELP